MKRLRTVLYLRVSDPDKKVTTTGPDGETAVVRKSRQETENQRLQLDKFINDHAEWRLTHTYEDHETGKNANREQFLKMFEDAKAGRFDLVVFWSLDRFTREGALPTLEALNKLSGMGVAYCSYSEQYLDTCGVFKDAIVAILATIAKQERIRISERVKAGLARAVAEGKVIGKKAMIQDLERFRMAAKVYSASELMQVFGCSRTTIMDAKRRLKARDAEAAEAAVTEDVADAVDTAGTTPTLISDI